ncbi:hypothetical protein Slala03_77630 [Streptomyces lavendulae subsp. lavendulae]|nr:hypothetical protein Slala03_77630 [Streptomyces lavendulae subsp. lavendulae]
MILVGSSIQLSSVPRGTHLAGDREWSLARDVCHGRRGIYQAYQGRRPGPGQAVRAASSSAWARAQTARGWKVSELQVAEVSSPLPW